MLLVLKNILGILLKADCGANRTYILSTLKSDRPKSLSTNLTTVKNIFEHWLIISILKIVACPIEWYDY